MSFQIHALPKETFAPLFSMSDEDLAAHHAVRQIVDGPGVPCRVSLSEAIPGETVILTHYHHQTANTPYRASHALFVREEAQEAQPEPGEIPALLTTRLISLRGFSRNDILVSAEVSDGADLNSAIEAMFADAAVSYIHLHNAREGCYHARVTRTV